MIRLFCFSLLVLGSLFPAFAQRPTLIVTTDIGQDPDDQQSMVRLLHYANEFQLAGLIANADANYADREPPELRDSLLHQLIDAYAEILPNLQQHDPRYPSAASLHALVKKGCEGNGRKVPVGQYVGKGFDTEGSEWIIQVVQSQPGPICVAIWGGACDLAQALWKARATLSPAEFQQFVQKLRVYFIGKQDSSNEWILQEFPELWVILALHPEGNSWRSSYRGMFLQGDESLTSLAWLEANVLGKNPLGDLYPTKAHTGVHNALKEGDTPSMLFFLNQGLNLWQQPELGGWGGRFQPEGTHRYVDVTDPYPNSQSDTVVHSALASVYRWREAFQRDFANRIAWGSSTFAEANHAPLALLQGFPQSGPIRIQAQAGSTIQLDASASLDLEGDALQFRWYQYPERLPEWDVKGDQAQLSLTLPAEVPSETLLSLVLEIEDDGALPLIGYRRVLVEVE
ncbi:MAG: nucleoside hydrolase-like domain-containing protein [Bacteroidota bacterium]